jgi:hypothetical protein
MTSPTWPVSILFPTVLVAIVLTAAAPSRADVISATPTLPLLGVPYVPSTGAGCFPTINACISGGSLTLTSLVSNTFVALGEDLLTDAVYTGTLTDTANNPIGPVTLTGTVEQLVLGRTFSSQTGSWTTDLTALSLSGPVLGRTLTLDLDPSKSSSGTTSITPIDDAGFRISSFFDVFAELTLDTTTPLHTTVGPIEFTAAPTPAPEPAGLALLGLPLLALSATRKSGSCLQA